MLIIWASISMQLSDQKLAGGFHQISSNLALQRLKVGITTQQKQATQSQSEKSLDVSQVLATPPMFSGSQECHTGFQPELFLVETGTPQQ